MSDQPEKPAPVAAPAAAGWRVVYFLRKPPWVREEPIATFVMDGEHLAFPMVRGKHRTFVVRVDKDEEHVIAAPGEPAEAFVEEAKESARQHRAWLDSTREERKREREIEKLVAEMKRRAEEFEATGRTIPPDHPARGVHDGGSLILRLSSDDHATPLALTWFLVEHCEFAPTLEVVRSAFEQRFGAFLDAYQLPRPDSAALLRHMHRVEKIESFRAKGKVDGWRGFGFVKSPPREAYLPETDEYDAEAAISRVFIAHCVRKAHDWQKDGVPQHRMVSMFRAWCIGYRVKPLGPRELARLLSPNVSLGKKSGAEGERVYEGVQVRPPKPGDRVLRPPPVRRSRSGD